MRSNFKKKEPAGNKGRRRSVQCAQLRNQTNAVRDLAASALVLPRFHRSVPVFPKTNSLLSTLMFEEMVNVGIIQPDNWKGDTINAAIHGLSALNRNRLINVGMSFSDDISSNAHAYNQDIEHIREWHNIPDDHRVGHFSIHPEIHRWYALEPNFMKFESVMPGLGITLYDVLVRTLQSTVGCICPEEVLNIVKWIHWQHCDDESEAMEQFLDGSGVEDPPGTGNYRPYNNRERRKAMENADFYRKRDFDRWYQPWSYDPKKRSKMIVSLDDALSVVYNSDAISIGVKCSGNTETLIEAITAGLMLNKSLSGFENSWLSSFEEMKFSDIASPIILRPSTRDDTHRLIDDLYRQECEGDGVEQNISCAIMFDSDDTASINTALRQIEKIFHLLYLSEGIIKNLCTLEDR